MSRAATQKKRGRPPKPPGQARRSPTGVALSEQEREHLRREAKRAGKTLSEYIRDHLPL